MKIVFVTGPNGAGKEYICQNVLPIAGVKHRVIGISNLLGRVELPPEEKERMKKGGLVSTEFVTEILEIAIMDQEYFHPLDEVLFVDGFPRNIEQASFVLRNMDPDETAILHVDASRETCYQAMLDRIKKGAGRTDDNDHAFSHRWSVYEDDVLPATRRLAEDFPLFTVYGGKGIPEAMKLAPILRMLTKLEVPLFCNEHVCLHSVCKGIRGYSKSTLRGLTKRFPRILEECPAVSLAL
jgi:adenylate kinase family enzyme